MPWQLPIDDSELLRLAKGYPYVRQRTSYLFAEGEAQALETGRGSGDLFAGRTPVIAHGSNRAVAQLYRKFGRDHAIPVTRAELADYDVVYSAHMTRYGAIAANLAHREGLSCEVWVTWLDDWQLKRMHETELGAEIYHYGWLSGVTLSLDGGPQDVLDQVGVYLSTYGYLPLEGEPIGLAAVPAERRGRPALDQEAVLGLVREQFRPALTLDDMILNAIRAPEQRQSLIDELRATALPPAAPHFESHLSA